jgi:hypothetical protein
MKMATMKMAALLWAGLGGWACGTEPGAELIPQQARVSECGGFGATRDGPRAYCDAELLRWQFQAGTLSLTDQRVELNCCGLHGMQVELVDGVYLVTETDEPGDGRCHCMCVFDFNVVAEGIPEGVIRVRLERMVTDWPEASGLVWEGDLDLAQGSGEIVVSSAPSSFCGL